MRALIGLVVVLVLIALFSGDSSTCATLSGSERDQCIVAAATTEADPGLCDSLEDGLLTWCYTEVALHLADPAVCTSIPDERGAEFCQRDVYIQEGDLASCTSLSIPTIADDCHNSFARSELNWEYCTAIKGEEFRDRCLSEVSIEAGTPLGCLEIGLLNPNRVLCLFTASLKGEHPETCAELAPEDARACYVNIALNTADSAVCERIPDAGIAAACLNQIENA